MSALPLLHAQLANEIPRLILLASHHQDQSMAVRDRTRYRQELKVQRFPLHAAPSKNLAVNGDRPLQMLGQRKTVVTVEPSLIADAQGRYEVLVRILEDTDDQGRPKAKIDPKAQPGLLVEVLWDELFFPLQEEKLPFLKFTSVDSTAPGFVQFHFEPKTIPQTMILASGAVTLDPETGAVEQIHVEALHNLRVLNKQLGKIESISAEIKYASFHGAWNFPATAMGQGTSRLPHLEGFFQFEFRESGHEPVMKIPETQ